MCRECNDAAWQHLNRSLNDKLVLSEEEALALDEYFVKRAGYISPEFDAPVHKLISRIQRFLQGQRDNN